MPSQPELQAAVSCKLSLGPLQDQFELSTAEPLPGLRIHLRERATGARMHAGTGARMHAGGVRNTGKAIAASQRLKDEAVMPPSLSHHEACVTCLDLTSQPTDWGPLR